MTKTAKTKNAYLSDETIKQLSDGLSRIEGHVGAVKRMIQQRRCCDEILTQTAAVRSALSRVTVKLVEEELLNCLTSCGQFEAEERMSQAMKALSSMLKHG